MKKVETLYWGDHANNIVSSRGRLPASREQFLGRIDQAMYQQHNANLAELMAKDREIDMAELDKAWTAANPET